MLSKLPSGETILLTLWELGIAIAVVVFAVIIFAKVARSFLRFYRKHFSPRRRSKSRNTSSAAKTPEFSGALHKSKFSKT
jgi:hypothetical protein